MSKFDLFTERAKKVLALAQEEALRLNHDSISTEHLLLGLVSEGEGVAASVLHAMGVRLPQLRATIESDMGRGPSPVTGQMDLTPRAKMVLEMAVDESRRMSNGYVGTEHILLGLCREGEGRASVVLESCGIELTGIRLLILQVLAGSSRAKRPREKETSRQVINPNLMASLRASLHGERTSAALADHEQVDLTNEFSGPRLSTDALQVLAFARSVNLRGNVQICSASRILDVILKSPGFAAYQAISAAGVTPSRVRALAAQAPASGAVLTRFDLESEWTGVRDAALESAQREGGNYLGTIHILHGLLLNGPTRTAGSLVSLGLTHARLNRIVRDAWNLSPWEPAR